MLKAAPDWLVERPIAHRALHDLKLGRAENSWRAFDAAITAGYAIECDVQTCASGEPVVFHDTVLARMTGVEGNVRDHTPDDLRKMRLAGTEDGIHTLSEHLAQVAGRVPLIVELKGLKGHDAGLVQATADALSGYDGPVAVMSFAHWLVNEFAKTMPHVPRGLTAEGDDETRDRHATIMEKADLQFVSYSVTDLPNPFVAETREYGLPVITWTVRNEEHVELTNKYADQMTFECFLPETPVLG
ncbi:glycerophosphodiester phosphodiesterase family protein [Ahrensia sp. R2A130]|uniref:glycerophosphodiester phosphodiesterase family protein n=1 Tax=Ahrensia sp. R2A130 TaxID=744979 RepID=UPI0001E0BC1C|nr:glycerophosphodiester phosphodiesterase family protein [Ahrensia sp. R2A130]EFL90175.1 glycerophosphoryl diester phosphodiesterase [Ahrensia sp. R2A130]